VLDLVIFFADIPQTAGDAEGRAILEKLSRVIETYQERVTQTIPEADLVTFRQYSPVPSGQIFVQASS
jgi:hypothetical protein